MTRVLPCDVTKPDVLLPHDIGQFDVVTIQLILETACRTFDAYSDAVKNIGQLVRPGGRLIMVSIFEADYYFVGGKAFFNLPVTKGFVEEVLALHGFEDISSEARDVQRVHDVKKFCIFHAVKRSC